MARISRKNLIFSEPERSEEPSPHGSQREDSILANLPGWSREAPPAAKAAFLPGVAPVSEGNGRGRGATFIDGFRPNGDRSCGGDFVSLKAPKARTTGARYTTSHDLFTGREETLRSIIAAMYLHKRNRKKFPCVVVHTTGDTFDPVIEEFAVVNLPDILTDIPNPAGWPTVAGIPVKPEGFRAGRGGNPSPVWLTFEEERGYYTLCFSTRGCGWSTGNLAAALDAAVR